MDCKTVSDTYLANTYKRNLVLARGEGSLVWDDTGRRYIDFGSGIAVNGLGVANPEWVRAVSAQLAALPHASNLYYTEPAARLAHELCARTGMKKVFFGNSGAEANECAIKCARRAAALRGGGGEIVTLQKSFHGRTLATLAATGQPGLHESFDPLPAGFVYAEPTLAAVEAACSSGTCAVLLELVQGEGGVNALEPAFVQGVEALCRARNLLLLIDEVQTGNGRSGTLFAYQQYGISPDVVTTAKGLGNGLPIGAALFAERTAEVFAPGTHGSTFGGNPAACAGALEVLRQLTPELLAGVTARAARIREVLSACPKVAAVTGLGLMIGLQTTVPAGEVVAACQERGLLVLTAKDRVRLLPALNIPTELLEEGLGILREVLS